MLFPSLHVFNSLSACIAIYESAELRKHRAVSTGAYILAGLIILATMFLKQHSVLDVMAAFVMAYVLYQFVYAGGEKKSAGICETSGAAEYKVIHGILIIAEKNGSSPLFACEFECRKTLEDGVIMGKDYD